MFQNPIQQQQGATAPVVQQAPQSSAVGDLANLASTGLQMWQAAQPQPPSASEIKEMRQTEGSQTAVKRINEFHHLRESKGEDYARRWLNRSVLQDQGGMTESTRSSYMSVIRGQAGSQLIEEDLALETEFRHEQLKQQQQDIQAGRELAGDPSLSDEQALAIGFNYRSEGTRRALRQDQLALQQQEMNTEQSQRKMTSLEVFDEFSAQQTAKMQGLMMRFGNLSPDEQSSEVGNYLNELDMFVTRLESNANQVLRENGGSLQDISSGDIDYLRKEAEFYRTVLTGERDTDLRNTETNNLLSQAAQHYAVRNSTSPEFISAGISALTGVPMTSSLSRAVLDFDEFQPRARVFDAVLESWGGIGASFSKVGLDRGETGMAVDAISQTVRSLETQWAQMPVNSPERSAMEQQVELGVQSIVDTLWESGSGKSQEKAVVNSSIVLPKIINTLATLGSDSLSEKVRERFEQEGVEASEVFERSFREFTRSNIIPSLRAFDENFLQAVTAEVRNGAVRLSYNEDRYNELTGGQGSTRSGKYDTRLLRDMGHNRRLRKVEQHLNEWGQAYEKFTGESKDSFIEAITAQFAALGRLYQEQSEFQPTWGQRNLGGIEAEDLATRFE